MLAAAAGRLRPRRDGARMGVTAVASWLSLGEGSTPLVEARRTPGLYLKLEGLNPTGSFKDRGMVVAVERAAESGARAVVCASTGNTAASAAAYAARAGLEAVVLTPAGATAGAHGARGRHAGGRDRGAEARAGPRGRRARARGTRELRRRAPPLPGARRARRLHGRQLA